MVKRYFYLTSSLLTLITGMGPSLAATENERIDRLEEQVEALTEALEEVEPKQSRWDRLSIGGYGELHYNNLNARDAQNDLDQIDFHRFVLYLGYEFTESLRFHSELELEHSLSKDTADGSSPGEVELEQAYIQYDINDSSSMLGGLFLLPIGILNETHEPPTFYGVERNDVENIIIPTTWWAGGVCTACD